MSFNTLNKDFESRVRLGIMSVLIVNQEMDFLEFRSVLQITDGNLASHTAALEKKGYLQIKKDFVGKKTKTTYQITAFGKQQFTEHLKKLENLIKSI